MKSTGKAREREGRQPLAMHPSAAAQPPKEMFVIKTVLCYYNMRRNSVNMTQAKQKREFYQP